MPDRSEPGEAPTPVLVMRLLGLVAALVLLAAAVVAAVSWPTTPQRSTPLPIRFHAYDPATGRVSETPRSRFQGGQLVPAATVGARTVESGSRESVRARWHDATGYRTNSVDLSGLEELRTNPVPLSATSAAPPGNYQFVLAAVENDQVVEVLAWVHVKIER
ncbi:hypothetical protein GA0070606_2617 [Micromonospora citrea]|uniref:Uncharacterized protein n=1 Tax=Micromonospora citrea TaxID=47855 RepID=A0A1C6UR30_9ACTN|nr:hypothetical protein [Micromonospora citrea]SCL56495.1 hypothetical protein GA0070606_2617 [Micromonospora citrea]